MIAKLVRLARLGPHPVLLTQTVVHRLRRTANERRLRRDYESLIVRPSGGALRLAPLEIGRAGELPPELDAAAERLLAEAEDVVRHRVEYLGSGRVDLGDPIDWHTDFKSGYRWAPGEFYLDVETIRLDDASDAKVPWELSRGHQLLTLARAFALSGDERFAREHEAQLRAWLAANPPGRGINWSNPMEIAIRAVNWIWSLRTLEQRRPVDGPLAATVADALAVHARHIAMNLEGGPHLRSNHYLADILGLLAIGASLEGDEARRWLETGHAAFETEIQTQVHPDGVGFEASLPYHGLALEMFLIAKTIADGAGRPFSRRYEERLAAMVVASGSLRHADGRVPQFGDSDSGRILPAGFDRPPTGDHLLSVAAALGLPDALPEQPKHEEVAWTLGLSRWSGAGGGTAAPRRDSFPVGGIYVLRNDVLHVPVRCGDVGQNGNGGHAHNDVLSFELSYRGIPIVVDPGTYLYTAAPDERNAFRSTAAHNTVVVNGQEINPIDREALFSLRQAAHPSVTRFVPGTQLSGEHDGYERLPQRVTHRRSFALEPNALVVTDELGGNGEVEAVAHLHFAAGTDVTEDLNVQRASVGLQVSVDGADSVEVVEGWVSDSYGARTPARVLVARAAGALPLRLVTRIEGRS